LRLSAANFGIVAVRKKIEPHRHIEHNGNPHRELKEKLYYVKTYVSYVPMWFNLNCSSVLSSITTQ